jgi:hypothetical protein
MVVSFWWESQTFIFDQRLWFRFSFCSSINTMTMIVSWLLGVCMFIGVAITWRMYEAGTAEHSSDYSSQLCMLVE